MKPPVQTNVGSDLEAKILDVWVTIYYDWPHTDERPFINGLWVGDQDVSNWLNEIPALGDECETAIVNWHAELENEMKHGGDV